MDTLVRYSEIHTKKGKFRSQLLQILRQRVQDKLEYEEIGFEKVSAKRGRIIVRGTSPDSAEKIAQLPGVSSASHAIVTDPHLCNLKESVPLDVGESFGVRVKTRNIETSSSELEQQLGSYIQNETGAAVDLEEPETWIRLEVTSEKAYIFTEVLEGPGGIPAASQGKYIALISGGIDSPVAAYKMMVRGADIFPVYFYNRPYAAEDHLLRFQKVLEELKKFHPGKTWDYAVIDMEKANKKLQDVSKGRMVVHRRLMFEAAEKLRQEEGFDGIVTGEALGQKSSQTPQNLFTSSHDLPVYRPLIGFNKNSIIEISKRIETYSLSEINSSCARMAPNSPSTNLSIDDLEQLKDEVCFEELLTNMMASSDVRQS